MKIEEIVKDIEIGVAAIEEHLDVFTEQEKEDYYYMINNIELLIRIAKKSKQKVCSICGKKYIGDGNNAQPINNGICCDKCNTTIVIPRRIQDYGKRVQDERT